MSLLSRLLLSGMALGLIAACTGGVATPDATRTAPSSPRSSTSSPAPSKLPLTPAPSATASAPIAAPTVTPSRSAPSAPPGPAFRSSAATLSPSMRARMTGVSWHPGCPVSLDQLRLLRVGYWGFDGAAHRGELVVDKSAASALSRAFGQL